MTVLKQPSAAVAPALLLDRHWTLQVEALLFRSPNKARLNA